MASVCSTNFSDSGGIRANGARGGVPPRTTADVEYGCCLVNAADDRRARERVATTLAAFMVATKNNGESKRVPCLKTPNKAGRGEEGRFRMQIEGEAERVSSETYLAII